MLYLSGIILSFFLSFVLATKKNKTSADIILVAWLIVTGFHLLTFYLFYTKQYDYPTLIALGFPLPLAQGPFLFLYTSLQTSRDRFRKKHLLHFLPVVLSYVFLFGNFFLMSHEQKVGIFQQKGEGYELQMAINTYSIYLSGIIYIALSLIRLLRYRKNLVHQFSNTDKINFNWLLYLIIWMVAIWLIVLFIQDDAMIFGAAAMFVLWLGYFGIKQVHVFHQGAPKPPQQPVLAETAENAVIREHGNHPEADKELDDTLPLKYQKSALSDHDAAMIHEQLKVLLAEQKPYVNPELTLYDLAKTLGVHPNNLSQVINTKENKSFYDLVNEKRIEEFIRLIAKPSYRQYTLVSVAYECGFNSKATFNRNFKKYTGLTPTEYVKSAIQQVA